MDLFVTVYFLAMVVEMAIRTPIRLLQRRVPKTTRRVTTQEQLLLTGLFLTMLGLPVLYAATSWLSFANYTLPAWARWLGLLLMVGALFLFWRAHADLGLNWSPSLEIRDQHELITHGIYGLIRHPMYASQWLWVLAQSLLLPNWIAGWADLVFFSLFYFLRVRAEEQLMLEQFGERYRSYMQKVGGVIPKVHQAPRNT